MGRKNSKGFQQMGSVATGLTSWMSAARKRRLPVTDDEADDQVHSNGSENHKPDTPEDAEIISEAPLKRSKSNSEENGQNSEEQEEKMMANDNEPNGKVVVNIASDAGDVDEGVGLDVTDDENSPLLVNSSKEDDDHADNAPSEEYNGTTTSKESTEEAATPESDNLPTDEKEEEPQSDDESKTEKSPLTTTTKRKSRRSTRANLVPQLL